MTCHVSIILCTVYLHIPHALDIMFKISTSSWRCGSKFNGNLNTYQINSENRAIVTSKLNVPPLLKKKEFFTIMPTYVHENVLAMSSLKKFHKIPLAMK